MTGDQIGNFRIIGRLGEGGITRNRLPVAGNGRLRVAGQVMPDGSGEERLRVGTGCSGG